LWAGRLSGAKSEVTGSTVYKSFIINDLRSHFCTIFPQARNRKLCEYKRDHREVLRTPMSRTADILLCVHSQDSDEIEMAVQYWTRNEDGSSWGAAVREIAERFGIEAHELPAVVRRIAQAYDLQIRCIDCNAPRIVESRSALSGVTGGNYICEECRSARAEIQATQVRIRTALRREQFISIIRRVSSPDGCFDYSEIDYFDAVLSYAIMLASDTSCASGRVGDPRQLSMCSSDILTGKLLSDLFNDSILIFCEDTPLEAAHESTFETGKLCYYPLSVNWQFAADEGDRTFSQVFRQLAAVIDARADDPTSNPAINRLWWTLALDDARNYLREQTHLHCLPTREPGEKTEEALRYALQRFSIPQVRNLIWRVTKDAAALSTRRDFHRMHALNTIPGALIRICDRALSDGWTINPYCKKWDQEEPLLTTLLFDRILQIGIAGFKSMNGFAFSETEPTRSSFDTQRPHI